MAEYVYNPIQEVQMNQPVLLESSIPCNKGYVIHRNGAGILKLRGIVNNQFACFARYQVTFNANIAVPTGGTVEAISLAVSIDGDADPSSTMIFTPAAVDTYGNVGAEVIVAVPAICGCESVSVRNTSTQPVLVQNANLVISYQGIRS